MDVGESKRRRLEIVLHERPEAVGTHIHTSLSTTTFEVDGLAPMVLIPFTEFAKFGSIPRSSDRSSINVVHYENLVVEGKRSNSLVAFVSHRWLNPTLDPRDMHPDRGGVKYRTIVEGFQRLLSGLHVDINDVYLWIDFCCIEQDEKDVLGAGVRSLPAYIERSDIIFTPYNENCFDGTEDEPTLAFRKVASGRPDLNFFYNFKTLSQYMSRGWCRLEVFMGSQCPLPPGGFGYFQRMGVLSRSDRPHVFFGDMQIRHSQLPETGPRIDHGVFQALNPVNGAVTVESDREVLQRLVDIFQIEVATSDMYIGDTLVSARHGVPVPHGKGRMVYVSGAEYDGNWADGKWEGLGKYTYTSGTQYTGEWKDGKRHGRGRHCLSNGLVFEGTFVEGNSHGPGKLFYQNGKLKFEGTKANTAWNGPLKKYYPSGVLQYEGFADDNMWTGMRTEYAEDGSIRISELISGETV